jgi:hypothetical protein
MSPTQLRDLIELFQSGQFDQKTLNDIQSVIARGPKSIKSEARRNKIKGILSVLRPEGQRAIREAVQTGDQARINQVITERLTTAIQSGATPGVTVQAPRVVQLADQQANLRAMVLNEAKPLGSAEGFREKIQLATPLEIEGSAVTRANLEQALNARQLKAETETRLALEKARVGQDPLIAQTTQDARNEAFAITPEKQRARFRGVVNQAEILGTLESQAPQRNLRFLVEGQSLSRPQELRRGLSRLPFLGQSGINPAQTSIEGALKLAAEGTPEALGQARTQATGALQTAARGPGRALLKGGGLAAALLLLPSLGRLLTGGEEAQPGLPPLLQAQLLQLMSNIQNQEALTQSLVGSRGAQAQKNLAQADLLRLQALTQQGGAVPQVV